jgi:anti-sigma-K factor RskA
MTREFDRGELQDRLPEYVHGTLPADERASIERALARDPDLARELEVVRAASAALGVRVGRTDAARVVAALPKPGRRRVFGGSARIRVAAAIATIAVGGASLAVVQQAVRGERNDPLVVRGESASAPAGPLLSVSFGYDLSSLDDADLDALLADLEQSAGLPPAEPRRTAASDVMREGVE